MRRRSPKARHSVAEHLTNGSDTGHDRRVHRRDNTTQTIKLDEVNEAFDAMERGEVIRSVITTF